MPHIFRLHSNGPTNLENWDISKELSDTHIQTITSTVTTGNSGKIGSSIPSVFARMQLFDSAFKSVVASNKIDGDTIEHLLVSDCLDLLQFLFMYGNHDDITYTVWNKSERLSVLENSNNLKHRNFGRVLSMFFDKPNFSDFNQIILIKYKGIIVGGTSPLTICFTSPNWKRKVIEFGLKDDPKFRTTTEDVLFDDIPSSIVLRDKQFRIYMHRLCEANREKLSNNSLYKYIDFVRRSTEVTNLLNSEDVFDYTLEAFSNNYKNITVGNSLLFSGAIQLYTKQDVIQSVNSDYKILPSVDNYKIEKDNDGNERTIPVPLILIQGYNNPNLKHNERSWDPQTLVPDIPRNLLSKRTLPDDNSTKYPYLTTGDFFQEKLLELRNVVDSKNFFTPTSDAFSFLIPIRRKFFDFFSLEDIKNNLSYSLHNDNHQFELRVPLQNGQFVILKKSYGQDDIGDTDFAYGYNIGIFPFYKLIDSPNRYSVGLYEGVGEIELNFCSYNGGSLDETNLTKTVRSSFVNNNRSVYYNINSDFDFIQINRRSDNGLIIPLWKSIDPKQNTGKFSFAIDFGTTNTYVAYNSDLPNHNIESLKIENDQQLVMLFGNDFNEIPDSKNVFELEMLPTILNEVDMPFRTMLYESIRNVNNKLFEEVNIGFKFYSRQKSGHENRYLSNLKWLLERNSSQEDQLKLQAFLEEILWMCKAKIINNNGKLNPEIIYMKPLSMKNNISEALSESWNDAVVSVFGKENDVCLIEKIESEMPYFAMPPMLDHHNAINVDIGGGTSDLFFGYNGQNKFLSTSFMFAGNDIWGDGIFSEGVFNNGFLSLASISDNREVLDLVRRIKTNSALNSSDLSAYFFKEDLNTSFTHNIKRNSNAKLILVIHLAAIVFKICKLLDDNDLPNPNQLSFSGKGSEYINMITSKPQKLIQSLFDLYRLQTAEVISIEVSISNEPKKLTSVGAIKSLTKRIPKSIKLIESTKVLDLDDAKMDQLNTEFSEFLIGLASDKFTQVLLEYDEEMIFNNSGHNILERLEILAYESFKGLKSIYSDIEKHNPVIPIKSPMFFWYLKHSIYNLSIELLNGKN